MLKELKDTGVYTPVKVFGEITKKVIEKGRISRKEIDEMVNKYKGIDSLVLGIIESIGKKVEKKTGKPQEETILYLAKSISRDLKKLTESPEKQKGK